YHMIDRIMVRIFSLVVFLCSYSDINAQENILVRKADSLFNRQKFTEALEVYNQLYASGLTSSAILLKMAFIEDASGNYADALYYMDKYYLRTADRSVIGKIEEVAGANDLSGYQYDDISYFGALLSKYKLWVIAFLALLMLSLTVYIYEKKQEDQKPISAFVLQIMVGIFFLFVANFKTTTQGIIVSNQTLLRTGPSAGAEPLELIRKGHKVEVLSNDKIWSKIRWDGEEVYIRSGRLKTI
ncbi:MAG: SH3 domain-containing protein, partial [Bacteroidota bacterium]